MAVRNGGSRKEKAGAERPDAASPRPGTLRLLREDQVAVELRKAAGRSGPVSIAAPFWGDGAKDRLGLEHGREVRVLCRLEAPGCNPHEIMRLLDAGAKVRSHRRLHAKIYLAGGVAIVGSSNPSRHGVTQDGDTVGGSVEANILTDDRAIVDESRSLFEQLWTGDEKVRVSRAMVQREIDRRAGQPPPVVPRGLGARTLLAACREAPELFDRVYVCAYEDDLGNGGKMVLAELKARAAGDADEDSVSFRRCWGYQLDEPPPAGCWIVDLDCRRGSPVIHGAAKVPTPALRLKVPRRYGQENDVTPAVKGVVAVPGAYGAFRIAAAEREAFAGVAPKLLRDERELIPLAEVVAMIGRRVAPAKPRRSGK